MKRIELYEEKIRIQKFLSSIGVTSRRNAERLILNKKVLVNNIVAKIGDKINQKTDTIRVNGVLVKYKEKTNLYIAIYKPRGYVTSMKDEFSRKCIVDLTKNINTKVYSVGRLDKDSEGLLLLTNDGNFANTVMHPSSNIEKKYIVTTKPAVSKKNLCAMRKGITVNGEKLTAKHILVTNINTIKNESVLKITLTEGKNRHIRKMCDFFNLSVVKLKRMAIGPVKIGNLKPGEYRNLQKKEIDNLMSVQTLKQTKSTNKL